MCFTAGVRQDDNDDFGEHTSYRVTGAYLMELNSTDTLKFKSSYGTGFRAPAPAEVAYNAGAFASPPASLVTLKEENSEGFEVGVEYYSGTRLKLEAVYFNQEIEDAIVFDIAGFSGYLQDIGTSTSEGVELSGRIAVNNNWNVSANYTYNDNERPNGLQRRRRPEAFTNSGVSYNSTYERLSVNAFDWISEDCIDAIALVVVSLEILGGWTVHDNYKVNDNV